MFDMAAALGDCRECLLRYGGHAAAAGLAIVEQYIQKFRAKFEEEARRRLADVETESKLSIDALVSLSEIDDRLVKMLDLLEPYGCMNPAPVFCSFGVTIAPQSIRELQGGHLRMTVKQGPRMFNVIGFRMGHRIAEIRNEPLIDIAFSPRFNTWRGETSIQLLLKDLRLTAG
jgi:single-stranded-DNA-specific exonuclease